MQNEQILLSQGEAQQPQHLAQRSEELFAENSEGRHMDILPFKMSNLDLNA